MKCVCRGRRARDVLLHAPRQLLLGLYRTVAMASQDNGRVGNRQRGLWGWDMLTGVDGGGAAGAGSCRRWAVLDTGTYIICRCWGLLRWGSTGAHTRYHIHAVAGVQPGCLHLSDSHQEQSTPK